MALSNRHRVGKAMDLLKEGLGPYVEREFKSQYGHRAGPERARKYFYPDSRLRRDAAGPPWARQAPPEWQTRPDRVTIRPSWTSRGAVLYGLREGRPNG